MRQSCYKFSDDHVDLGYVYSLLNDEVGQHLEVSFQTVPVEIVNIFRSCVLEGEVVEKMRGPESRLVEDVGSVQNQFEEEGPFGETNIFLREVVTDGAHPAGEGVRKGVVKMIDHPQQIDHTGMTIYDILLDLSIYVEVAGIVFQGN